MNIEVRSRDTALNAAVREHAATKIHAALERFTPAISSIKVGLADANGPKGGIDKTCRVLVRGKASWLVFISETDADPYALIDRTGDRLGQAVSRAVERHREHEKDTLREMG